MSVDVEKLLQDSELRYTKESDPDRGDTFLVPFGTSGGPVSFRMTVSEDILSIGAFLWRLDSLSLIPSKSLRDLLLDILRLNSASSFGRVFVWRSTEDESDWIGIEAGIPVGAASPGDVCLVIDDVALLAEQVIQEILRSITVPQKQPG